MEARLVNFRAKWTLLQATLVNIRAKWTPLEVRLVNFRAKFLGIRPEARNMAWGQRCFQNLSQSLEPKEAQISRHRK